MAKISGSAASNVKVKFTKINGGMSTYQKVQIENLKNAVRAMGDDILATSKMLAPYDSGDLSRDGRVVRQSSTGIAVVYGGSRVPYARKRHFENNLNPWTKEYLANAGESARDKGLKRWFR